MYLDTSEFPSTVAKGKIIEIKILPMILSKR